jgi:rRNA maturation endonuclease Nob1
MSVPKKIDRKTANELRSILTKINITQSKVKIDLDNDTIEVEDDYSIDDILESAGVLTPEQAKELIEEVKKMREEEWN